jgi:hypothetical protein
MFPHSFGAGVKGGLQALQALSIAFLESDLQNHVLMQSDVANGYGNMRRAAVEEGLEEAGFGPMEPTHKLYLSKYRNPNILTVMNKSGQCLFLQVPDSLLQGDDEAPFYFSFAFAPVLKVANEALTRPGSVSGYLDDIIFAVHKDDAERAYHAAERKCNELNLSLPLSKASVLFMGSERQGLNTPKNLSGEELPVKNDGTIILGTPVGTPAFVRTTLHQFEKAAEVMVRKVCEGIDDAQCSLLLLRYCTSRKMQHLFRVTRPSISKPIAEVFANHAVQMFDRFMLGRSDGMVTEAISTQAQLPVRLGGVGLPCEEDVEPAFLSTWAASMSLIVKHYPILLSLFERWNSPVKDELRLTIRKFHSEFSHEQAVMDTLPGFEKMKDMKNPHGLQQILNQLQAARRHEGLLRISLPLDEARLRSVTLPGSLAILNVIPMDRETRVPTATFQVVLRRIFGVPLLLMGSLNTEQVRCRCADRVLVTDTHLESCGMLGGPIHTHDACVRLVARMTREAGAYVFVEPRGWLGFGQGGADLHIEGASPSLTRCLVDFGITSVSGSSNVQGASRRTGFAAAKYEREKNVSFDERGVEIRARGFQFHPLIMENFGGAGPSLQQFVREVEAEAVQQHRIELLTPWNTSWTNRNWRAYWVQRLSLAFHRTKVESMIRLASSIVANHDFEGRGLWT